MRIKPKPLLLALALLGAPLHAAQPNVIVSLPATEVTDGTLQAGIALPITRARLQVGGQAPQIQPLTPDAKAATFPASLTAGRTRLYTWFDDAKDQPIVGADYVKVTRL
jgi:hypothetical protein